METVATMPGNWGERQKYKREKAKDERARTQERETEHESEEEERGDVSAQENRIREGERESG